MELLCFRELGGPSFFSVCSMCAGMGHSSRPDSFGAKSLWRRFCGSRARSRLPSRRHEHLNHRTKNVSARYATMEVQ